MKKSDITCNECEGKIIEYYDENYKGIRGKCPFCMIDFPLE